MRAIVIFTGLAFACLPTLAHAEDWKTRDGRVYSDVSIVHIGDSNVAIWCADGSPSGAPAVIMLSDLPTALQKKLNYDPNRAQQAIQLQDFEDREKSHTREIFWIWIVGASIWCFFFGRRIGIAQHYTISGIDPEKLEKLRIEEVSRAVFEWLFSSAIVGVIMWVVFRNPLITY